MEILTLGEKIRRRRKSLRLTLKDVAGDSVTPAQLSYVESNKCKPSSSLLKYICDKIDMDVSYALESEEVQADRFCDQYLEEYKTYKSLGNVIEAEKRLLDIESIASQYGIDKYLAFTGFEKGINALEKGDIEASQSNLLIALQFFMKSEDYINIVRCCRYLGDIAYKTGAVHEALNYYLACMSAINEYRLQDSIDICKVHLGMAKAYHSIGSCKDCWEHAKQLLYNASKKYSLKDFTDVLSKVSSVVDDELKLEEYSGYLVDTVDKYRQDGDTDKELELNVLLNMLNMKMGYIDKVVSFYNNNSEKLNENDNYNINVYILLTSYYAVKHESGDFSVELLNMVNTSIMPPEFVGYLLYIKVLCCKETDMRKGEEYLYESLSYIDEKNSKELLLNVNLLLSKLFEEDGKYEEAIEHLVKCIKLLEIEDMVDSSINISNINII